MDEAAVKKLIESAVRDATSSLKERALRGDAVVCANRALKGVSLSDVQKQYVIDTVLKESLPLTDGALDEKKFAELTIAEAKRYGASISGGARVTGMGQVPIAEAAKEGKKCKACDGEGKDDDGDDCSKCDGTGKVKESARKTGPTEDQVLLYESTFGMSKEAARRALEGRAA